MTAVSNLELILVRMNFMPNPENRNKGGSYHKLKVLREVLREMEPRTRERRL